MRELFKNIEGKPMCNRVLSKIFDQVGHETKYAVGGNVQFFSLTMVNVRSTKIMNINWALYKKIRILRIKTLVFNFLSKFNL